MVSRSLFVVLLGAVISRVTAQLEEFPDCAVICGNESSGDCGTVEAVFCVCALPTFPQDVISCAEERCSEEDVELTRAALPRFCTGDDDDDTSSSSSSSSTAGTATGSSTESGTNPPTTSPTSSSSSESESSTSESESESESSSESTSSTESSEPTTTPTPDNVAPTNDEPQVTETRTSITVVPPPVPTNEEEESAAFGLSSFRGSALTLGTTGAMVLLGAFLV